VDIQANSKSSPHARGKSLPFALKDKGSVPKERILLGNVSNSMKAGKRVDVYYEAGRYRYWVVWEVMKQKNFWAFGLTRHPKHEQRHPKKF